MDEISNLTTCLYVNNLNEKIKVDVVKKMLNMLFSQYGRVKSVTAYSGYKTKGQAWVQFDDKGHTTLPKSLPTQECCYQVHQIERSLN